MSFGAKATGDDANPDWANLIEASLGDGNPIQIPDFIIYKVGSTYKTRNCEDGTIDYSGTTCPTVIQDTINGCVAGNTIGFHNDQYPLAATQIDFTGVNLIGAGNHKTQFTYSGVDYAILYDGAASQQIYYRVSDIRVTLSDNDGKGIKLSDNCHYFDLERVYVEGPAHANSVGICIDGGDNGAYWNNLISCRTYECGTGILLTSTGADYANGNNLISCVMREPYSRGIDVDSGNSTVILGGRTEGAQAASAVYVNDDNTSILHHIVHMTDAGAKGFEIAAGAANTHLTPGYMSVATYGNRVDDGSTTTIYPNKAWTATSVDLSGGAETLVCLHSPEPQYLARATLLYTEASSADVGVTIEIGKETDRNYYYTGASEVDKAQWYTKSVALLENDIAAGDTVTFYNPGAKAGTGEIKLIIDGFAG